MVHDDTMGSIGLAIGSPSGKQNMIAMLTNPMLTDEGFGLKYQCNKLCSLAPYADWKLNATNPYTNEGVCDHATIIVNANCSIDMVANLLSLFQRVSNKIPRWNTIMLCHYFQEVQGWTILSLSKN